MLHYHPIGKNFRALVYQENNFLVCYRVTSDQVTHNARTNMNKFPKINFFYPYGDSLLKRTFDIVVSLLLLIILFPFLLLVALLIYLDSPGPIFFSQPRPGKDGQRFTIWKFRSMCLDAEIRREKLLDCNEMSDGIIFKMKNDPRLTRMGKIIRQLSIDELPQLFNVLRGEMSLVGPRPHLLEEAAKYTPYQRQRLKVKPGISCIWQVSGRSDVSFSQGIEMDLFYIQNQSFWLDISILLRTVPIVLKRKGAY